MASHSLVRHSQRHRMMVLPVVDAAGGLAVGVVCERVCVAVRPRV